MSRYVITTLTGRSLEVARDETPHGICTNLNASDEQCGATQGILTIALRIGARRWVQETCAECLKLDTTLRVIDLHKVEPETLHCECPLNGSACCKCGKFECTESAGWAQRHNAEFVQRNIRYGYEF